MSLGSFAYSLGTIIAHEAKKGVDFGSPLTGEFQKNGCLGQILFLRESQTSDGLGIASALQFE